MHSLFTWSLQYLFYKTDSRLNSTDSIFVPILQEIVFSFDEPCTRSYVPYADGKSSVA